MTVEMIFGSSIRRFGLVLVGTAVTLATVATIPVPAHAQSASAELKERVDALVHDLDADDRSTRVRAERALVEIGPAVLPKLPPPDALASASVRETVRRIRIHLEREQARDSVKASHVTLAGTFRLEDVLLAVAEQTGNPLGMDELPPRLRDKQVTVDFDGQSFWSVIDELEQRENVACLFDGESPTLKIVPRHPGAPAQRSPATSVGPFRIGLESLVLRPNFRFAARPIVRVSLDISVEPRLRPLFLKYDLKDFSLDTPEGVQLQPFSAGARVELPVPMARRQIEVRTDFVAPLTLSRLTEVDINGEFTMETAAAIEEIRFRDLSQAEGVARTRGGVTVKLDQIEFRPTARSLHDLVVRATVSYDTGGPAFESHRTWIFHNDVFLETDQHDRIPHEGTIDTISQGPSSVVVQYTFKGLTAKPEDYRFVYVAPVMIINVPVRFSLESISINPVAE